MKFTRFILFFLWISFQIQLGDCKCSIYNFGDFLVDIGNLLISVPGQVIGRFSYVETLGYPTGHFSDGRLIIDFIAKALGQPWLNPFLRNSADFSVGVNFAVAGATALNPSFFQTRRIGALSTQFSLDTQVHWFLQHKKVYCSRTKEAVEKTVEESPAAKEKKAEEESPSVEEAKVEEVSAPVEIPAEEPKKEVVEEAAPAKEAEEEESPAKEEEEKEVSKEVTEGKEAPAAAASVEEEAPTEEISAPVIISAYKKTYRGLDSF